MAKTPSVAIGIDVGRNSMKAVQLQRRGANRFSLSHFATRELMEEAKTTEALAANLKALLQDLGTSSKACGIAFSGGDSFVRIIEQPQMPPEMLRNALRLNGATLLNQECRDFVLDCDLIVESSTPAETAPVGQMAHYIVGGLPRISVQMIHEACQKAKIAETVLQLAPVAVFNGFEFAQEETFNNQAFVLVEIGHRSTTVIVGVKRELILVRSLEYGGSNFVEELICHGAASFEEIAQLLDSEEVLTVENARLSLSELVRSISSSIGYFEARREDAIPRVYVSGGLARLPMVLRLLTEELQLPCEAWDPFAKCEINVPPARRAALSSLLPSLGGACGAAIEILKGR